MTITLNNKKVKAKPMKDNRGNDGFFILAEELGPINLTSVGKKKKEKTKPSVFKDVKEAIIEMDLIEKGKMKAIDAHEMIKSLRTKRSFT